MNECLDNKSVVLENNSGMEVPFSGNEALPSMLFICFGVSPVVTDFSLIVS